jgi:hypothetical protein
MGWGANSPINNNIDGQTDNNCIILDIELHVSRLYHASTKLSSPTFPFNDGKRSGHERECCR